MKLSRFIRRLTSLNKIFVGGSVTLRAVICGLFIALIALFFTSPAYERSAYDKPLPLPPELGLE